MFQKIEVLFGKRSASEQSKIKSVCPICVENIL